MPISRNDLIKQFRSLDFNGSYSGGKYQFVVKGKLKIRVQNPHKSEDISDSLLHEILRQAGISKNEWNRG